MTSKVVVTLTEKEADVLWAWGLEGKSGAETDLQGDGRTYAAGCRAMDKLLRAIAIDVGDVEQ